MAQRYTEDNPANTVLFFSTDAPLDKSILEGQSIINQHVTLPLGQFSSTRIRRYIQITWQLIRSFVTSLYHLHTHKTEKVISTGGLVALPVCLAAMFLRIPVELYELNAVPGKAIKALAPLAQTIHVCFAHAIKYFPKNRCVYTPYPVRFNDAHKQISKEQACKELGLDPHKKTLFIMGGSQGSVQLNNEIKKYIETSNNPPNRIT
jgi:UDP-N-acetylglucosamine--N-acetylmuramyl-(pentapeptide) pyrophosphoryl-undecaprenol N-acetylglucosamine transferase